MTKRNRPPAPLIAAADDLLAGIDDLERLSSQLAGLGLPTWRAISRAGKLLGEALEAHHRFASGLERLSALVSELRDRHNRAAEVLAEQAGRVEARRSEHQGFEERFAAIAAAARDTDALVREAPEPLAVRIGAIQEHLARGAEAARVLAGDAEEAGFTELRQQADGIRAQLEAMMRKIANASPEA